MFLFSFLLPIVSSLAITATKIGFGSCMHQDHPQEIWNTIKSKSPDYFVLLGDNIYASSIEDKAKAYKKLADKPTFKEFRKQVPIFAVWDDNDYGKSDSGAEYEFKKESKNLFLEFLNTPKTSERLKREGIYESVIIGKGEESIQLILLDLRTFRSSPKSPPIPFAKTFGRYIENMDKNTTVLGDEQWKWLGEELKKKAKLRVIASSFQFLPTEHHWESWYNFPLEREKLIKLIKESGAKGVVFISGDRHMGSLMKMTEGTPYAFYEATSSGITQAIPKKPSDEPNKYRIGSVLYGPNFGFIQVNWPEKNLEFQIFDDAGKLQRHQKINFTEIGY